MRKAGLLLNSDLSNSWELHFKVSWWKCKIWSKFMTAQSIKFKKLKFWAHRPLDYENCWSKLNSDFLNSLELHYKNVSWWKSKVWSDVVTVQIYSPKKMLVSKRIEGKRGPPLHFFHLHKEEKFNISPSVAKYLQTVWCHFHLNHNLWH